MTKTIAEVYVPTIGKTFDFILPTQMKIYDAINLIINIISEHEKIKLNASDMVLCQKNANKNEQVLNKNITIYEANIRDGSSLIII